MAAGSSREGTLRIQLLSHPGCPNATEAHGRLLEALVIAGATAEIEEIDTMSEATPDTLRGWGSPTILVDGKDVAGENPTGGARCRLYRGADGEPSGAPSVSLLATVLKDRVG